MSQPDITKNTITQPIQIKLKNNTTTVATSTTTTLNQTINTADSATNQTQPTIKRTQKAKHKTNPTVSNANNDPVLLSNSIDEIIGDMIFQEPNIKNVPSEEKVILEQQVQVLQKQKELLEQLQQGIRPGWFIQCVGRRADGKQCTRNIKKGSEFCMGHSIKTAYGRIDVPILNTIQCPGKSATKSISGSASKPKNWANSGESITLSDSEDEDTVEIPDDVKELLDDNPNDAVETSTATATATTTARTQPTKKSGKGAKSGNKAKPVAGGAGVISASIINEALADPSQEPPAAPKKRGRRRKLPIDPRFGNNDYIIMWPIICEDQRFLTDRYENIYSNDPTRPVFIGVRDVSGQLNRSAAPKTC